MKEKQNENSGLHSLIRAFRWESKICYHALKMEVIPCLLILLIITVLPKNVCQFMDQNMNGVVAIVNVLLAVAVGMGFLLLPYLWLIRPYGEHFYDMERSGDISSGTRILVRVLFGFLLELAACAMGLWAVSAMEKFADANHSWLSFSFTSGMSGFYHVLLINGLLMPLTCCYVFLRRYLLDHERHYFSTAVIGSFLFSLLYEAGDNLTMWMRLGEMTPPYWLCMLIWTAMILLISTFFFFKCVKMEERELEFWD